jgi:hypothetical protein
MCKGNINYRLRLHILMSDALRFWRIRYVLIVRYFEVEKKELWKKREDFDQHEGEWDHIARAAGGASCSHTW